MIRLSNRRFSLNHTKTSEYFLNFFKNKFLATFGFSREVSKFFSAMNRCFANVSKNSFWGCGVPCIFGTIDSLVLPSSSKSIIVLDWFRSLFEFRFLCFIDEIEVIFEEIENCGSELSRNILTAL